MTEPKYKLITENHKYADYTKQVYRIVSLRDFGRVEKGQLGGYIESEENLSHEGNCWVDDDACVYGHAKVKDNALVAGEATVCNYAIVEGNAKIWDKAKIANRAKVSDEARIYGCAKILDKAKVYDNAHVFDDARVSDVGTEVFGNVEVGGNVSLFNGAKVCENAVLFGNVKVYNKAAIRGDVRIKGNIYIHGEDVDIFSSNHIFTCNVENSNIETIKIFNGLKGLVVVFGNLYLKEEQFIDIVEMFYPKDTALEYKLILDTARMRILNIRPDFDDYMWV